MRGTNEKHEGTSWQVRPFFSNQTAASSLSFEERGESTAGSSQQLVSSELLQSLEAHSAADPATLNILWNSEVWTVADLANVQIEKLCMVSLIKLFSGDSGFEPSCYNMIS
mgnify:CR=1 FL=1